MFLKLFLLPRNLDSFPIVVEETRHLGPTAAAARELSTVTLPQAKSTSLVAQIDGNSFLVHAL